MKYREVKKLNKLEENMRWYLQNKRNEMDEYRNDNNISAWNEALLFADFLLKDGKKWAVRAGLVVLMKEED